MPFKPAAQTIIERNFYSSILSQLSNKKHASKNSKLSVIFELNLNTNRNSKSPFELVFYITGYTKQFEKLRIEKLNKLESPKVFDHNMNVLTEGET